MTATRNITLTRGDSWAGFIVTWKDSDGDEIAIDSARMHFRRGRRSDESLLELSDGDGIEITNGTVAPSITPEQSENLRDGFYDLEVTGTNGVVRTLVAGRLKVTQDVAR